MGEGELTKRVCHVATIDIFALARSVALNIHRQKKSTVDQQELLPPDEQNLTVREGLFERRLLLGRQGSFAL